MPSVLVIDDDPKHRKVVQHLIKKLHPETRIDEYDAAASGGLENAPDVRNYSLVILDTTIAGQNSVEWMKTFMGKKPGSPAFIFLSSITDIASAATTRFLVNTIKLGAVNFFFKKKLDMKELVQNVTEELQAAAKQEAKLAAEGKKSKKDKKEKKKKKQARLPIGQDEMQDTMTEIGLAMVMMHGDKKWPFTMDDILQGNARLGEFKIISFLGEDAVASSFEATVPGLKHSMVIKLVNQLRVVGQTIPPAFTDKFNAVKNLRHPNIIHLYNYEVIYKRVVVGIEYLRGGTLEARLKEGRLEEKLAIRYFRQLLSGMAALHSVGLELHEVMPKHLMLRDEDTLVITHLGLLNELHAMSEITGEWNLPQISPVYTAPETVQTHTSDPRSDIYLAGLIGFEMLAGKPPYSSGSTQDILYAHAAEPVPHLPDPRHPLNPLISKMLTKSPEQRIQKASEALTRLDKIYPSD